MIWKIYRVMDRHPPLALPPNCSSSQIIECVICDPRKNLRTRLKHVFENIAEAFEDADETTLTEHQLTYERLLFELIEFLMQDPVWGWSLPKAEEYDILNPFIRGGKFDERNYPLEYLWRSSGSKISKLDSNILFDFQKSCVLLYEGSSIRSLPFKAIFQKRPKPVTPNDFTFHARSSISPDQGTVSKALLNAKESFSNSVAWDPHVAADHRHSHFIHALFKAFNSTWNHVLAGNYGERTARIFAKAIIQILTLSFEIDESQGDSDLALEFAADSIDQNLPAWEPIDDCFIGNVKLIVCQELEDGIFKVKTEIKQREFDVSSKRPHFVILSIRYVMLVRVGPSEKINFTVPREFLFGSKVARLRKPEAIPGAIDYLLWATEMARPSMPKTSLTNLPIEIQNLVLENCSEIGILSSQIGCSLGIGSSYIDIFKGKQIYHLKENPIDQSGQMPCLVSRLFISPGKCALIHTIWDK